VKRTETAESSLPFAGPNRRAFRLLAVLLLVGVAHLTFLVAVELNRYLGLRETVGKLEADVAANRAEASELRAVAERADDAVFREQLARIQGFMFPDETRIVTTDDVRPSEPTNTDE
jgi:hypothetical protein